MWPEADWSGRIRSNVRLNTMDQNMFREGKKGKRELPIN
jgi:hypothetical protein